MHGYVPHYGREDTEIKFRILQFFSQRGLVSRYAVLFCWLAGLLLGFCAAKSAELGLILAVSDSIYGEIAPIRLLLICIIPFAISAISVLLSENWLMLLICVIKAFAFSFCSYGIGLLYGQASWLVRFLFLFSDCLTIPVLLFYCLSVRRIGARSFYILSTGVALFATAIAILDYIFIVPLLRAAIS